MSSPLMTNEHARTQDEAKSLDASYPVTVRMAERDLALGVQQSERGIEREISALRAELDSAAVKRDGPGIDELQRNAEQSLERNKAAASQIVEVLKDPVFRNADKAEPLAVLRQTGAVMSILGRNIFATVSELAERVGKHLDKGASAAVPLPLDQVEGASTKAAEELEVLLNQARYLRAGLSKSILPTRHGELSTFQRPQEKALDEAPLKWAPGFETGWKLMEVANGETISGLPVDRKEALRDMAVDAARELVVDALIEKGLGDLLGTTEVVSEAGAEEIAKAAPQVIRISSEALSAAREALAAKPESERKEARSRNDD